jgi:hypothetical protein
VQAAGRIKIQIHSLERTLVSPHGTVAPPDVADPAAATEPSV